MAARSGCPAGLARGSTGGECPSVHLSVLGDAMAPVGSASPAGCEGLDPALCWLCYGRSGHVLCRGHLGRLPVSAWALPSAAGRGNRTRCFSSHPEAGKCCGRAPAEMDKV